MKNAINDKDFANAVCKDVELGKAVVNSIKDTLRKLRSLFSAKKYKESKLASSLFSQLDILKEAEKLWMEALNAAIKNQAAIGVADFGMKEKFIFSDPEVSIRNIDANVKNNLKIRGVIIIDNQENILNAVIDSKKIYMITSSMP